MIPLTFYPKFNIFSSLFRDAHNLFMTRGMAVAIYNPIDSVFESFFFSHFCTVIHFVVFAWISSPIICWAIMLDSHILAIYSCIYSRFQSSPSSFCHSHSARTHSFQKMVYPPFFHLVYCLNQNDCLISMAIDFIATQT